MHNKEEDLESWNSLAALGNSILSMSTLVAKGFIKKGYNRIRA